VPLVTAHSQFPPVVKILVILNEVIEDVEVTATNAGPAIAPGPLIVN
jgi:hypothetical protein